MKSVNNVLIRTFIFITLSSISSTLFAWSPGSGMAGCTVAFAFGIVQPVSRPDTRSIKGVGSVIHVQQFGIRGGVGHFGLVVVAGQFYMTPGAGYWRDKTIIGVISEINRV